MGYYTIPYLGGSGISIVVLIGLYLLLTGMYTSPRPILPSPTSTLASDTTGQGERFNPGQFLAESNPLAWASVGIALCIGLSVFGAGWYVTAISRELN